MHLRGSLRSAAGLVLTMGCLGTVQAAELPLSNPGFEEAAEGSQIPGWDSSQHVGEDAYEIGLDPDKPAQGKRSLRMKRVREQIYGAVEQRVALPPELAGKSLDLSAMLKTKDVGPGGWMLVATFYTAAHGLIRQVRSAPATGSSDWKRVKLQATVPPNARGLAASVMLMDQGTGWVDDLRLSVD